MLTPQDTGARAKHLKPSITLTASDHERLSGLVRAAMNNMPDVASGLADEIDRAHIVKRRTPDRRGFNGLRSEVPRRHER